MNHKQEETSTLRLTVKIFPEIVKAGKSYFVASLSFKETTMNASVRHNRFRVVF